jgi:hypothetical protein
METDFGEKPFAGGLTMRWHHPRGCDNRAYSPD